MRVLVVGAGGVGTAVARIAARRDFVEHLVVADHDLTRGRNEPPKPPVTDSRRSSSTPPTSRRSSTCCVPSAATRS